MKLNKINNLVILAAGRGIRMKPLTNKIPKAMAPLNQSTLIAEGLKTYEGDPVEFENNEENEDNNESI